MSSGHSQTIPWRWVRVLAVQPLLSVAILFSVILFGIVSTATQSLNLPTFLPILPGGVMLVFLGIAFLYSPVYIIALAIDIVRVRRVDIEWTPSRWLLIGGGTQIIYFVMPIIQAYEGQMFDEIVFGSIELVALSLTALISVQYVSSRDAHFTGAPPLVALCASVWSRFSWW